MRELTSLSGTLSVKVVSQRVVYFESGGGRPRGRSGSRTGGHLRLPRGDRPVLRQDRRVELRIRKAALADEDARRIRTNPGIGRSTAAAFLAYAPEMNGFRQGRDFSAWLGFRPRQLSTGGKTRLAHIGNMEQYDMRRLLINCNLPLASEIVSRQLEDFFRPSGAV